MGGYEAAGAVFDAGLGGEVLQVGGDAGDDIVVGGTVCFCAAAGEGFDC